MAALSTELGRPVELESSAHVSGGCINETRRLQTTAGDFFVKSSASAPETAFSSEALALSALGSAQSELTIAKVVLAKDPTSRPGFLVLEYLAAGRQSRDYDEQLGRGLAALHRSSAKAFGFEVTTYCGATPQPNRWVEDWCSFYREQRLEHQLRLGAAHYNAANRKTLTHLFDKLDGYLSGSLEAPALIHGDLWAGNAIAGPDGGPALVDPAAYYAHREAELGMMTLMGGFSSRVYDAYEEAWPLQAGWRQRNPLYELYHLMNHATLFGGGYAGQAVRLAARFV